MPLKTRYLNVHSFCGDPLFIQYTVIGNWCDAKSCLWTGSASDVSGRSLNG